MKFIFTGFELITIFTADSTNDCAMTFKKLCEFQVDWINKYICNAKYNKLFSNERKINEKTSRKT